MKTDCPMVAMFVCLRCGRTSRFPITHPVFYTENGETKYQMVCYECVQQEKGQSRHCTNQAYSQYAPIFIKLDRKEKTPMKVTCIYSPTDRELMLFKRCLWITTGKTAEPSSPPSSELLEKVLGARHSPVRVLNYAFLIEGIPSNISTHLARHVHAVPFISSLRNDRQERMDGDTAPRNTPVDMIYYMNAEELMTIANKRLCMKASEKTRKVVQMVCDEAIKVTPELARWLVPMCQYNGGVCHEIESCKMSMR